MEWQVTALDISSGMLEKAQRNNPGNVKAFIQTDAEILPFEKNQFACAILFSVFPHFDKPMLVLKGIQRVLKPQGEIAIIHVKSPEAINAIHTSVGGAIVNDRLPKLNEVKLMLIAAGFEVRHIQEDIGFCIIGQSS
jgi:SAM-dependent methyltransferase